MEQNILRKVQLVQLEIAKEIRRVCEENGIPYFLCDGTLLGAVRHGGFIPWDDDMDLGMLKQKKTAPEIVGELAFLCGLLDRPEAVTPRELVPLFAWGKVCSENITVK